MRTFSDLVRARFDRLTARQKAVAKFVLEEPERLSLATAREIGKSTGTSETTVIRFCTALGYSGYGMLQEEIRRSMYAQSRPGNPLEAFSKTAVGRQTGSRLVEQIVQQDIACIEETLSVLDMETLDRVTDSILRAKKIVVIGLRASHAPAYWLAYSLNIICGETLLYRGGTDDANYLITEMNSDWLVIAFSFPRYAQETIRFAQAAQSRSARVVAVSDSELSPLARMADLFVKAIAPDPATLKGMAVIFSLLNVIIGGVMAEGSAMIQNRIEQYNASSEQFHIFADGESR